MVDTLWFAGLIRAVWPQNRWKSAQIRSIRKRSGGIGGADSMWLFRFFLCGLWVKLDVMGFVRVRWMINSVLGFFFIWCEKTFGILWYWKSFWEVIWYDDWKSEFLDIFLDHYSQWLQFENFLINFDQKIYLLYSVENLIQPLKCVYFSYNPKNPFFFQIHWKIKI